MKVIPYRYIHVSLISVAIKMHSYSICYFTFFGKLINVGKMLLLGHYHNLGILPQAGPSRHSSKV